MKQIKPIKGFDAIAFKRKAQRRIYQATKGMTPKEEIEYLDRKARTGPFSDLYKHKKERIPTEVREKKSIYKTR